MDIGAWLVDLGLGEYVPVFRDNDVDLEVLKPDHVLQHRVLGGQRATAHLDHDGLADKVVDVGQRLLQDARDIDGHRR